MSFMTEFFRSPVLTGSIVPSSRDLARMMCQWIDWKNARAVVELGPGTGAFTGRILEMRRPECRSVAVELNDSMCQELRKKYPDLCLHNDSVANLENICSCEGMGQVDAVLSGIPWAGFPEEVQDVLMGAVLKVLRPGGQFVTFAYLQGLLLPGGKLFKKRLKSSFSEVSRSPIVWMNLPPAFVYRCRR